MPAKAAASPEQIPVRPARGFWQDSWERLRRDRLAVAGGLLFACLCLTAIAAPWISQTFTGYESDRINLPEDRQAPSAKHWFGTDEYGRDYFTRTIFAGRVSLSIGILVAGISLTIGVVQGLAAGAMATHSTTRCKALSIS